MAARSASSVPLSGPSLRKKKLDCRLLFSSSTEFLLFFFFGWPVSYQSPAGLILTGIVHLVYQLALRFEESVQSLNLQKLEEVLISRFLDRHNSPFTANIYRQRDLKSNKSKWSQKHRTWEGFLYRLYTATGSDSDQLNSDFAGKSDSRGQQIWYCQGYIQSQPKVLHSQPITVESYRTLESEHFLFGLTLIFIITSLCSTQRSSWISHSVFLFLIKCNYKTKQKNDMVAVDLIENWMR
jgi:hypothetical protein